MNSFDCLPAGNQACSNVIGQTRNGNQQASAPKSGPSPIDGIYSHAESAEVTFLLCCLLR